ncbi:MFS transporter [Caldibacillus lycopersici]|uniref:MFS transporter n=1 Tax=Perspicuibacillus lycopersici TaxID=1325689 RepID=A0AAE3LP36_9BACI|nr:MFS transporter [Perspicuibacillus lycopersici]MCU9614517.1 MFS transporter [Perspicuibacillus lycopersici]
MNSLRIRFWVLITIVSISGFSQGMLLPLLAVLLESDGVSSTINGLHATGLYIGVLIASPFMEAPLRRFGYKPLIVVGGLMVLVSLFFFTLWDSLWFWFILRLIIGVGDHALHFSTQTWITSFSPENVRGRNISFYGLFFGIGFAAGPLMTRLITINEALPFMIASIFSLLAWLTIFLLKNELPEREENDNEAFTLRSTFSRFGNVFKYAWAPLLPAFCYGILEASLNSNFPVFGLRNGLDVEIIPIIVSAFSIGGILFQIPLGMLSDKLGRRNILLFVMLTGSISFVGAGLFDNQPLMLIGFFFLSGMLLGSTFSLSIAYMTDNIPRKLLPAGNLMTGMCFSIGSVSGPFFGGLAIDYLPQISFFYLISGALLLIFIALMLYKGNTLAAHTPQNKQIEQL